MNSAPTLRISSLWRPARLPRSITKGVCGWAAALRTDTARSENGRSGRIRTRDPRFWRPMLYQPELRSCKAELALSEVRFPFLLTRLLTKIFKLPLERLSRSDIHLPQNMRVDVHRGYYCTMAEPVLYSLRMNPSFQQYRRVSMTSIV